MPLELWIFYDNKSRKAHTFLLLLSSSSTTTTTMAAIAELSPAADEPQLKTRAKS